MKKTLKIAALVAAAVMAMGFVSCANDDAEDLGTLLIVKDYQEKKEAEAKAAAAAAAATTTNSSSGSSSSDALKQSGTFSVDITKLDFATATSGLSNTADANKNGTYPLAEGDTKLGDGYFTVVQSTNKTTKYYTDKELTKINAIELGKFSDKTYIKFTVTGSAVVTVTATSTNTTKNTSYLDIIAENGSTSVSAATGVKESTDVTKTLTAGTYWIVVASDETNNKNARITALKAVQTAS